MGQKVFFRQIAGNKEGLTFFMPLGFGRPEYFATLSLQNNPT
jgi:hypothetical protein